MGAREAPPAPPARETLERHADAARRRRRKRLDPFVLHDWAYDEPDAAQDAALGPLGARLRCAALGLLSAAVVGGALLLLARQGYHRLPFRSAITEQLALGALLVLSFFSQLVTRRQRAALLGLGSAALVPALLGPAGLLVLGYAGAVMGLARPRKQLAWRLGAAFVLWVSLPLACWTVLRAEAAREPLRLVLIVWASMLYGALYLLVEHRRAAPGRFAVWDDLLYLTALPRLLVPFFQPLSPSFMKGSSGEMDGRRALRAAGLGLWGAGLVVAMSWAHSTPPFASSWAQWPREFFVSYATAAGNIFLAMALFRALGLDLASGFKWPFLSRSFAEFFRTWNHYVRDAVLSLFYFPLIGLLRRRMPTRVAETLAPYLAIFLGSFVLNDALVPLVTSPHPLEMLGRIVSPTHLGALFIYWSAIIVPRTVLRRGRDLPESGWRRWLATAIFLLLYVALWRLSFAAKQG